MAASKPSYTQGPWFIFGNGHCIGGPQPDRDPPTAGIAMFSMAGRSAEENAANAWLCKHAPELVAALVECAGALQGAAECMRKVDAPKTADRLDSIALTAMGLVLKVTDREAACTTS